MTLEKGLTIYQGRGKTMKEAFMDMLDTLLYNEGLYCHKLADDDWFVGLNVLNGTSKDHEEWENQVETIYGNK